VTVIATTFTDAYSKPQTQVHFLALLLFTFLENVELQKCLLKTRKLLWKKNWGKVNLGRDNKHAAHKRNSRLAFMVGQAIVFV